jgi:EamA domain-containing membrane protein RarD
MQKILKNFYEWDKWTGIMHNLLLLLVIYIMYLFYTNKSERTLNNILLFTIIIGIITILHQILNIYNNKTTSYL